MPLYQVTALGGQQNATMPSGIVTKGILVLTAAAQWVAPAGAVVYLVPPPSAPLSAARSPLVYPGYGPPARPQDPGYVPVTRAGQFTASALASGFIIPVPPSTPVTPPPAPLPGAYLTAGCPPAGSVPSPAPPAGTANSLLYRPLNGQPGLHIATAN